MDQVLYGIDYIEYYFYWIYYKFIGYPLIIRICSIAVMFCIIAYLFLVYLKGEKRSGNTIKHLISIMKK